MPGVRSVAFGAWVRAASLHEPRERMGVSHLLEHMVFKGTRAAHARSEIALSLEALGGSLDAYTSREHTVFQARVLDEHLSRRRTSSATSSSGPSLRDERSRRSSGRWCSRRSRWWTTRRTISCSSCITRRCGAHPYGFSILGTRDTVVVARRRRICARCTSARTIPAQLVVAAAGQRRARRAARGPAIAPAGRRIRAAIPRGSIVAAAGRRAAEHGGTSTRDGAQTHIVARHADGAARRSAPLRAVAR